MVSIMENDTKWNLKEASEWLGISLNTLKKRMNELQIDTVNDGRKKLISSEDLQRLKEKSRKQKTIKMTDSIDGELAEEIKSLRERLEKVESKLIASQYNSQLIDKLTVRLLDQADKLTAIIVEQGKITDPQKKSPSEASEMPRQQGLSSESARSVAETKKAAPRQANDSQKVVSGVGKSNTNSSGTGRKKKASPQRDVVMEVINKKYSNGLPPRLEKDALADVMNELQTHENPEVRAIEKKYVQDIVSRLRKDFAASKQR
jgi:hypothetical protein